MSIQGSLIDLFDHGKSLSWPSRTLAVSHYGLQSHNYIPHYEHWALLMSRSLCRDLKLQNKIDAVEVQ